MGLPGCKFGSDQASCKPRGVSCLPGVMRDSAHPSCCSPGSQDTRRGTSPGHSPGRLGLGAGRGERASRPRQGSQLLSSKAGSLGASSLGPCVQEPAESTDEGLASRCQQLAFLWPLPHRECEQASVLVETTLSLVPCLNDCGPYGQCLLLRRLSYLYAGCSCKAGEGRARGLQTFLFFF